MAQSKSQIAQQNERRRLVAGLYLRRTPKGEIAKAVGVAAQTITRDCKYLEELWAKELVKDPVAQRARDLAATDNLERDAATKYLDTGSPVWWDRVMKALERRAKLLGLDKAPEGTPGSSPDNPLYVVPGEIDWSAIPDELADELLALNAKILALQPGSGGLIVEGEGTVVE